MALLLPLASLLPIWPGKNFLRPDSHIRKKQVIISMVFGLLAISGAELGLYVRIVTVNTRDAAPSVRISCFWVILLVLLPVLSAGWVYLPLKMDEITYEYKNGTIFYPSTRIFSLVYNSNPLLAK